MHFLFYNVPARREVFTNLTRSSCFPLSFCGHRWVENVPVAERAIKVWPMLQKFVDAAEDKRVQKPSTASYDAILAARGDPLVIAKLEFFLAIARSFNPFLQRYQTDEPVLPFLVKDLTELLMSLLRRFIKRELLQDQTPLQLTKMDISEEKNWVSLKSLDIGLGAESAIKALLGKPGNKIGELSVLNFRRECLQCLVKVVKKLQDKCPLKFPVNEQGPEWCITQMKNLVQTFIQGKQLAGGIAAGDVIIQQFTSFLSVESREEEFVSFQPLSQRLDVFLHSKLCTSHPDLLKFCQSVLLLSHGQATVERGFSVNKEVETCNLLDESLEALRLICDKVIGCGGILKVPLTKELLASAASARSHYRLYLENERKKKESATQELKRKAAEKELEDLRNQRRVLRVVCDSLEVDADKFAEIAEGKTGTKMAELITKSNSLRRRHKDKKAELLQVDKMIEEKATQLRHL
ncbi:hypothetical protein ABG768_018678 [Culter alburnus]|uniref:Uncharacterized protein n=1 Tax=Culter alburnus TaxID=194366 RepID=A0AAW2ATN0_CULAL